MSSRITISIPKDVHRELQRRKHEGRGFNVSKVCTEALRQQLLLPLPPAPPPSRGKGTLKSRLASVEERLARAEKDLGALARLFEEREGKMPKREED